MSVVIHIDDNIQTESIDLVMDFVEACVDEGEDVDDIVASMLCAVSAILESQAIDKEGMQ
jgi:hypothetical protein